MKRTWLTHVAIVASLVFGSTVSTTLAGNGKGGFSLGGNSFHSVGGSQGAKPVFSRSSNLSNLNNLKVAPTFTPQILKSTNLTGKTTLNPRISNSLGIGKSSGPVWTGPLKTDLFGKGGITKIPGLGVGQGNPGFPIDPGIGNGQPGNGNGNGNGNCNGNGNGNCGKGNCWFPPIILGCGNYGGCYPYPVGGCYPYPLYQTQPIVVTQQPVIVETQVAAAVAEKLIQVPVGTTMTFQGKDLGDKAGQVVLVVEKLSLGVQVNEWKNDQITATLPMLGIGGPTKAEIVVVKADGQIASTIKVELLPAQPAAQSGVQK